MPNVFVRNTDNILIMGDFNADCSYINNREKEELLLRTDPKYHWWIPDNLDTTVGNTDCAYDRLEGTAQQGFPFDDKMPRCHPLLRAFEITLLL